MPPEVGGANFFALLDSNGIETPIGECLVLYESLLLEILLIE